MQYSCIENNTINTVINIRTATDKKIIEKSYFVFQFICQPFHKIYTFNMRKLFILVFWSISFPFITLAQFHETFDDNSNRWSMETDADCDRKIESSKYILTTFNESKGKFTQMPTFFDVRKDFILEASIVQQSGSINNGFGFYWGKNGDSYNEFIITTNGYYIFATKGTGQWVQIAKIKPLGEANILRVERKDGIVKCLLNGELIESKKLIDAGFVAGFLNYTNMVLEVNYIDFIQENKIKLIDNMPNGLVKENLGAAINTTADDLSPKISADGQTLYFTRQKYEYNTGGVEDGEDIWISTYSDGKWNTAVNPGRPINSEKVDNMASVSADNNSILFPRSDKFVTRNRTETGWSEMIDLGLSYTNEATHQESQLSSDGKALLFAIKNKSNLYYNEKIDEKDIYISLQDRNGTWGEAINLGPSINTAASEVSPFLSADGRTLYFSTDGRPGFGNHDIFMAKRLGKGWDKWTEPLNLGPQINTSQFDAYYTLPASGDYAYIVSSENSLGKADILRLRLPTQAKPEPVALLLGKTLNAKTKKPVSAEVLLDDLGSGKEVAEANSNPTTGEFRVVLQSGANYGLHAAAKGYLSVNENLEFGMIHEYTEVQKDLYLIPIEIGETLQLNNIFFEQGKPILRAESFPELDRLATILKENPNIHIELAGHTDNVGTATSLMKLSQDRVEAVKKYLEKQEIAGKRIVGRGYGASQPREKNDTEEHKKMNRRVEFKITKK